MAKNLMLVHNCRGLTAFLAKCSKLRYNTAIHKFLQGGECMSYNKTEYNSDFQKNNYDRVVTLVHKGGKERLKIESALRGYNSVGALIKDALKIAFDIEV